MASSAETEAPSTTKRAGGGLLVLFFVLIVIAVLLAWQGPSCMQSWFPASGSIGFHSVSGEKLPYTVNLGTTPTDIALDYTTSALSNFALVADSTPSVLRLRPLRAARYSLTLDVVCSPAVMPATLALLPRVIVEGSPVTIPSPLLPFASGEGTVSEPGSLHISHQLDLTPASTVSLAMTASAEVSVSILSWDMNLKELKSTP